MRKGTHSCFECRRRKIKCIFSPDNPNVCTECFARGSRCVGKSRATFRGPNKNSPSCRFEMIKFQIACSPQLLSWRPSMVILTCLLVDQEHAESDVVVDHRKNLRERVARLESIIDTILEETTDTKAAEVLRNLGSISRVPPTPSSQGSPLNQDVGVVNPDVGVEHTHAPLMMMFDNAVLSRGPRGQQVRDRIITLASNSNQVALLPANPTGTICCWICRNVSFELFNFWSTSSPLPLFLK